MQIPSNVRAVLENLRVKTKPQVTNLRLMRAVDELFRPNAIIIGGTAGAIIYERITGNLVGGKSHVEKGRRRLIQLTRIIEKEPLNAQDLITARSLIEDLQYALNLTP